MDGRLAGKLTNQPTTSTPSPKPITRSSAIQALPPEVVARIKSSTTITTLTTATIGLLKNSLDASATKISIEVDFARGNLTLEDDGHGIPPAEFGETGGLGKLYHTSRYSLSSRAAIFGTHGTFLASLGILCLLTITSHHVKHFSTNSLIVHHSGVKSRFVPAPAAHRLEGSHGTRVVVRDLFGNMAVRVKQRALLAEDAGELEKLWEELKATITALLIAFGGPVVVKLRNTATGKIFRLTPPTAPSGLLSPRHQLAVSLLTQTHRLAGTATSESWIPASASSKSVTIKGVICLTPSPTKSIQYISLSIHALHKSMYNALYEHISRLFSHSHFGALPEEELTEEERERRAKDGRFRNDGGLTRRQMLSEKGVDRWPMFVLWIELRDGNRRGEEVLDGDATLQKIIHVLDALVTKWLEAHHFKTPAVRTKHASGDDETPAEIRVQGQGGRSTPRPYTGVPTVNALSRVKSSHNTPNTKQTRPGSAPILDAATTLKRPAPIEIETFTSKWPERRDKQVKKSDNASVVLEERLESADAAEDETITWVDPITKTKHLLNGRTGMRLPDSSTHAPNEQTRPWTHISLPSRGGQHGSGPPVQTEWLDSMLAKWDNPIFRTAEQPITQSSFSIPLSNIRTSKEIDQTFGEVSHLTSSKISKSALQNAKVIAQVDEKFILVSVPKSGNGEAGEVLVVIDQHAADERVKFEALLTELCMPPDENDPDVRSGIKTCMLERPIRFAVSEQEGELLERHAVHFGNWGILYDLPSSGAQKDRESEGLVIVRTLPSLIAERCSADAKLLVSLLRREIYSLPHTTTARTLSVSTTNLPDAWVKRIATCPHDMLSMAKSRACRSAIMFNDALTREECEALVTDLGGCVFPFVCAHGRPSLVPLLEISGGGGLELAGGGALSLGTGGVGLQASTRDTEEYAGAFERWQRIDERDDGV